MTRATFSIVHFESLSSPDMDIAQSHAHDASTKSKAAGTAMLLALAMLAACTNSTPSAAPTAPEAKRTHVYRIAGPYDSITLDPALANGIEDSWIVGTLIFNRLYTFDAHGILTPELATAAPILSNDHQAWTIPLRTDVRFHNDRAMNADDVVFTFERVRNPATASWAADTLSNIEAISAPDSHTVRFQLKKPQASFPAILTWPVFSIVPRNEVLVAGNKWGQRTVIGSGPFKLASWQRGSQIKLERNAAYFRKGLPKLDAVEISFNVVAPVALERRRSGEVDYAWFDPGSEEMQSISADAALSATMRSATGITSAFLWLNTRNKIIADANIRKAIAFSIDRQALAKLMPQSRPSTALAPTFDEAHIARNTFAPTEAATMLTNSPHINGDDAITLLSNEAPSAVSNIIEDLQHIGLQVHVLRGVAAQYAAQIDSGEIALVFAAQRSDSTDPSALFGSRPECDANALISFCTADVAALVKRAESLTFDDPQRTAIYAHAQEILIDEDKIIVPLLRFTYIGLGSDAAHDDDIDPTLGLPSLSSAWVDAR